MIPFSLQLWILLCAILSIPINVSKKSNGIFLHVSHLQFCLSIFLIHSFHLQIRQQLDWIFYDRNCGAFRNYTCNSLLFSFSLIYMWCFFSHFWDYFWLLCRFWYFFGTHSTPAMWLVCLSVPIHLNFEVAFVELNFLTLDSWANWGSCFCSSIKIWTPYQILAFVFSFSFFLFSRISHECLLLSVFSLCFRFLFHWNNARRLHWLPSPIFFPGWRREERERQGRFVMQVLKWQPKIWNSFYFQSFLRIIEGTMIWVGEVRA